MRTIPILRFNDTVVNVRCTSATGSTLTLRGKVRVLPIAKGIELDEIVPQGGPYSKGTRASMVIPKEAIQEIRWPSSGIARDCFYDEELEITWDE